MTRMKTWTVSALAAVAALSGAACGQSGWIIDVDYGPRQSSVHPSNPTCRVRITAHFPWHEYALGRVEVDVVAAEPGWAPPHTSNNLPPMTTGASPGVVNGGMVAGIRGIQLNFPSEVFANPRNPMPCWQSSWSASNFTPRSVDLATGT